jgi:PhoH-like ATPase
MASQRDSINPSKIYVLDTSVLMHDPSSVTSFADNDIVIPIWVIEELDRLKTSPSGSGSVARAVSRRLDQFRSGGSLIEGVKIPGGGKIFVECNGIDFNNLPIGLQKTNDNRIISIAKRLQERERKPKGSKRPVVLVSKDVNVRIKANACDVPAEDYKTDKQINSLNELYSGYTRIEIPADADHLLTELHMHKVISLETVLSVIGKMELELTPNQCCYLDANGKTVLAIYKHGSRDFRLVDFKKSESRQEGIYPYNQEQAFAYALIKDPGIQLISLTGLAGTGKTLLALLAGYELLENGYQRLLVYRSNVELGESLGFLPGDINDKFAPWMEPIFDNLRLVIDSNKGAKSKRPPGMYDGKNGYGASSREVINELMRHGLLEISPISYVRGRSLNDSFVIIDEGQNLTPHQIKTLITRIGRNSKMVLTGDPGQVDNRFLDSTSNGLSYAVQRLKGQDIVGHIDLEQTVRSKLARLAAECL